jgi:hypothetical protein
MEDNQKLYIKYTKQPHHHPKTKTIEYTIAEHKAVMTLFMTIIPHTHVK